MRLTIFAFTLIAYFSTAHPLAFAVDEIRVPDSALETKQTPLPQEIKKSFVDNDPKMRTAQGVELGNEIAMHIYNVLNESIFFSTRDQIWSIEGSTGSRISWDQWTAGLADAPERPKIAPLVSTVVIDPSRFQERFMTLNQDLQENLQKIDGYQANTDQKNVYKGLVDTLDKKYGASKELIEIAKSASQALSEGLLSFHDTLQAQMAPYTKKLWEQAAREARKNRSSPDAGHAFWPFSKISVNQYSPLTPSGESNLNLNHINPSPVLTLALLRGDCADLLTGTGDLPEGGSGLAARLRLLASSR